MTHKLKEMNSENNEEKVYYVCQGRIIACDNSSCKFQKFHYTYTCRD